MVGEITTQSRIASAYKVRMSKRRATPKRLPISPISLTCPRCKAKRGQDCMTTSGGFVAVQIEFNWHWLG